MMKDSLTHLDELSSNTFSSVTKSTSNSRFIKFAHVTIIACSFVSFVLSATILILYAYLTAYRFYWITSHAYATITNFLSYNGEPIAYIPDHVHMASYYASLVISSLLLLTTFAVIFISFRRELYSRFLNRSFDHRRLSLSFSGLAFALTIAGTLVVWIEWHTSFKIVIPLLPMEEGTNQPSLYWYTLDAYSCSVSQWLSDWQASRTNRVCVLGRAARWSWIPLMVCTYLALACAIFSICATREQRKSMSRHPYYHQNGHLAAQQPERFSSRFIDSRSPTLATSAVSIKTRCNSELESPTSPPISPTVWSMSSPTTTFSPATATGGWPSFSLANGTGGWSSFSPVTATSGGRWPSPLPPAELPQHNEPRRYELWSPVSQPVEKDIDERGLRELEA